MKTVYSEKEGGNRIVDWKREIEDKENKKGYKR